MSAGSAQSEAPYLDALVAYAARRPGRFHVPGHKGGDGADPELVAAFGLPAFDLDIPSLIEGIDVGPSRLPSSAPRRWLPTPGAPTGAGS